MITDLQKNQYVLTDENGIFNIRIFPENTTLEIKHPSYETLILSPPAIKEAKYVIRMREKVINMSEIVIAAGKWEQDKNEIAHEVVEVSPRDINFRNPQTAADALSGSGQVFVQKSQLGGGSPIIRGFSANSVLIVVDGVRMNNAIFRSGNLQNIINIDPNALEGAEVVFGPGSVLYGSDALGGVMDFHTKSPKLSSDQNMLMQGEAMTRYSSANNENTVNLQLNLASQFFGSYTSMSFSSFGDLRAGNRRPDKYPDLFKNFDYVDRIDNRDTILVNDNPNVQIPTAYEQVNIMQKFRFRPFDEIDMSYTFHYSNTSDIPRYDRLIEREEDGSRDGAWYYGPQKWVMHQFKSIAYTDYSLMDQSKFILAYQRFEESRNTRVFQSDNLTSRLEKVDVVSMNWDIEKAFDEENELFYGFELLYNYVGSSATRTNLVTEEQTAASTRYPDGGTYYYSAAAYFNYKWKFRPRWIMNYGARYSYVGLLGYFDNTSFFELPFDQLSLANGSVNGSASIIHQPVNDIKYSLMVSTGFRAPNLDDVGKVFDSEPGNVVVPNQDLKPEYSYNAEFGISKTFEEKFKIEGTVFYSYLYNAMERRNFTFNGSDSIVYDGVNSRVQAIVNIGQAYVYGASMNFKAAFTPKWSASGAVTYTFGEDAVSNIPLRHVTPVFGQLSVNYETDKLQVETFTQFNGPLPFDRLAPSEQNKPFLYTPDGALAWITLNIRGAYKINDNLEVNGAVENILDQHYRPYSSGLSAPGRNFILSARVIF
ncbi:TonB-dependent receptor plug domain-containing protein [Penaeicola halotolerans]|uniref:TonB-dependent receptor plug domain-containing protein n=1 Tax=Penaeicola halotolerans TaxID=2793196 RepID=UPI001CF865D8|nr:TonB-dependent receptor [Penaeicola halotolerans]